MKHVQVATWLIFFAVSGCHCNPNASSLPCASDSHCPTPLVCRDRVCSTRETPTSVACASDPFLPGCPCSASGETRTCFPFEQGTAGVGDCLPGNQVCRGGLWGSCEGGVGAALEGCDGRDNDCDGALDEGVVNQCGNCSLTCEAARIGPADLDPGAEGAVGVEKITDGSLTLSTTTISAPYLWAANDGEQTVSKVDVMTGREVARFVSAPPQGSSNRPSRTAVDLLGDAYVVNRAHSVQGSITKFAASRDRCTDRNHNGRIETSTDANNDGWIGAGEIMPWGADECMSWNVTLGAYGALPRSIAVGPGNETSPEGVVWVGTFFNRADTGDGSVYALKPRDGSPAGPPIGLPFDIHSYGAAIDCRGLLWIQNALTGDLVAVDTAHHRIVTGAGAPDGHIRRPQGPNGCSAGYGITVDGKGHVWVAGYSCQDVWRYRPGREDPTAGAWDRVDLAGYERTIGVAADLEGRVWVSHLRTAAQGGGMLSVVDSNATPPRLERTVRLADPAGTVADSPMGVGIDPFGRVWAITRGNSCRSPAGDVVGCAVRYDPATRAIDMHPVGDAPYTYSDFLGFVARNFSARQGFYRQTISTCDGPVERWGELSLDAEIAPGGEISVRARNAPTQAALSSAVFSGWIRWSGDPISLHTLLSALGDASGRFLEVEMRLALSNDTPPTPGSTSLCPAAAAPPHLRGLEVFADCELTID